MKFKVIKFPGEKTTYIVPTWNEMNQLAFAISRQMIRDKQKFDRIVTLAKGGWSMTRAMVDFLGVDQVASIGVKFYQGIYQKLSEPQIYQDLPEPIKGERVLLFDDVADSGGSLAFVKQHLIKRGIKKITTATLLYKPWSTFKPDYYGAKTTSWIVFPYEVVEDGIKLLGQQWLKQGFSSTEIIKRLLKLGIDSDWIKYFWK